MHLDLPDGQRLALDRPAIVGVLNLTPDSFSDGGAHVDPDAAADAALRMARQGAHVIDLGGESTRPGATRIAAPEQLARVMPVLERLADRITVPLSIDTTRSAVAMAALDAGASIINDVSAGREDPAMLDLAAERGAPIILMHMRGEPATMQKDPRYDDPVADVRRFLLDRARAAEAAGLSPSRIVLDPGIGFGKTTAHNLALLAGLSAFVDTGYPVLLGASRKRFIGEVAGAAEATDRDPGTAAVTAVGVMAGVAMFRVHDVAGNRQAADVAHAVRLAALGRGR